MRRETYEIIDPAEVGANASRIVLTARSGHAALKHRLVELGYEFEPAELDVINERDREVSALYTLQSIQISCGFPLKPTATLTLRNPMGLMSPCAISARGRSTQPTKP